MSLSFLLGTHSAAHLAQSPVPMFISYHRVWRRDRQLARCPWGQDSRGYARARGEVIADLEGMAGFEALVREWRALRPARPTQTALFKEVLNA